MIKLSTNKPPIWDEVHRHFTIDDERTIFTYGDTIYNPGGRPLGEEYIEHEKTHIQQQEDIGGPEKWWERFFKDPQFRYEQELAAYGRQYAFICSIKKDRNFQAKYLWKLAEILSGETYKPGIPHGTVMRDIRQKSLSYHYAK